MTQNVSYWRTWSTELEKHLTTTNRIGISHQVAKEARHERAHAGDSLSQGQVELLLSQGSGSPWRTGLIVTEMGHVWSWEKLCVLSLDLVLLRGLFSLQKHINSPLTDEWINTVWSNYPME